MTIYVASLTGPVLHIWLSPRGLVGAWGVASTHDVTYAPVQVWILGLLRLGQVYLPPGMGFSLENHGPWDRP